MYVSILALAVSGELVERHLPLPVRDSLRACPHRLVASPFPFELFPHQVQEVLLLGGAQRAVVAQGRGDAVRIIADLGHPGHA